MTWNHCGCKAVEIRSFILFNFWIFGLIFLFIMKTFCRKKRQHFKKSVMKYLNITIMYVLQDLPNLSIFLYLFQIYFPRNKLLEISLKPPVERWCLQTKYSRQRKISHNIFRAMWLCEMTVVVTSFMKQRGKTSTVVEIISRRKKLLAPRTKWFLPSYKKAYILFHFPHFKRYYMPT